VSHRQIKLALQYYTGSRQYLKALIESEHRYNLDGSIASLVNQESKDDAKARLLKKTSKTSKSTG